MFLGRSLPEAAWWTLALSCTHCSMFELQMLRQVIINCPTVSHLDFSRRWQNKINARLSKERLIDELYFAQVTHLKPSVSFAHLLWEFSQWKYQGAPVTISTHVPFKKNAGKFPIDLVLISLLEARSSQFSPTFFCCLVRWIREIHRLTQIPHLDILNAPNVQV